MPDTEPLVFAIAYLLAWLVAFGLPAAWLARERGRDPANWLVAGLLLGPVALILVGLAPLGRSGRYAFCPACIETVWRLAPRCPYCGHEIAWQ